MVAFSLVKPSSVKLRALPAFPANVNAGPGLNITKANGAYTFSTDFSTLTYDETPTAGEIAASYMPIWDKTTKILSFVPSSYAVGLQGPVGPTGATGAAGNLVDFESRAAVALATIPATGVTYLRTAGYYTPGDGGDALYKKVGSQPSHAGKVQSADNAWWEIVGVELNVRQFGVKADGTTDDTTAAQGAIDSPAKVLKWPAGVIPINATGLNGAGNQIWRGAGRGVTILQLSTNPTADMILFNGKSNVDISDITLDYNNKTPAGVNCAITFVSGTNVRFRHSSIIHMTRFGVIGGALTDFCFEDLAISKDSIANTSNIGILLTAASGANNVGKIKGNYLTNTSIELDVENTVVIENVINGYGYGGGIVLEGSVTTQNNIVAMNIIFGESNNLDSNGTLPGGIETYSLATVVALNISHTNGGPGYTLGGIGNAVVGNIAYNNSQRNAISVGWNAPGFAAYYASASYNPKYSAISGNVAFDSGGTQAYGLTTIGATAIQYVTYSGNFFTQNAVGQVSLSSLAFNSYSGADLHGTTGYGGGAVGDKAGGVIATLTVNNAQLGDRVVASLGVDLQGVALSGYVSAANTVKVTVQNLTGASVTLGTGTLNVVVSKGPAAATY